MSKSAFPDEIDVSSALDLLIPGLDVVVKRRKSLPKVAAGSDIDIFSIRPTGLLSVFRNHFAVVRILDKQITSIKQINQFQWHFDVRDGNNSLGIRFDIYGSIPDWENFRAKGSLFEAVITSSLDKGSTKEPFPAPNPVHEALVRHFEQLNALGSGALKNHHTEWILKFLTDDQLEIFWESFHHYLSMPAAREATQPRDLMYELTLFSSRRRLQMLLKGIRTVGLKIARAPGMILRGQRAP